MLEDPKYRRIGNGIHRNYGIRTSVIGCLVLLSLCFCGCDNNPPTYPVEGRVVFADGSPVHTGTVELKSVEYPNIQARGSIDIDGNFILTTFSENDGAIAGEHRCVVVQMVITEDVAGHIGSLQGVVDPTHAAYHSSGLTVDISEETPNKVVLKVRKMTWNRGRVEKDHEHDESEDNQESSDK